VDNHIVVANTHTFDGVVVSLTANSQVVRDGQFIRGVGSKKIPEQKRDYFWSQVNLYKFHELGKLYNKVVAL
jgi:hypothetical protein